MGKQLRIVFILGLIMFTVQSGIQAQIAEDLKAPTESEFLKRNKTLSSLNWQDGHVLVLTLKKGKQVVYDLNIEKDRNSLYDKYGSYPQAPPTGRVSRRMPKKTS